MKKLIFLLLIYSIRSTGQECQQEDLRTIPGKWKLGMPGSIRNVSAADLQKERLVLGSIHKMIELSYKPSGCQITYANVVGKHPGAASNWIADPYSYKMYVLRYLCNRDKPGFYVDVSTPTTVSVDANVIYSLDNLYAAEIADDDFRGYLKLSLRPQKKNGFYFMGEVVVGDSHLENKIKEYRWLITYNDTLPFRYLTRREYLMIQRKRLLNDIQENPGEKSFTEKYIKNIDEYLKLPESELSKEAVAMWNEEQRFEKFVEEGTRGSFIAVKPNLAYFRKKLAKSAPQFFSVVYKISKGDPVFEDNIARIQKAIDFELLRKMLGK